MEEINIFLAYSDLVQFLIDKMEWNEAIEIQTRKIKFLEYLREIGAPCDADYSESLALLNELHEKLET